MTKKYPNVTVSKHQLVLHFLTLMRDKDCSQSQYRQCLNHIYMCLTIEALRDFKLPRSKLDLVTSFGETAKDQSFIHTDEILIAAIMRGGMAPADMLASIFPLAPVAHFGIEGGKNKGPIRIGYERIPEPLNQSKCIVVEPRIETGGTLVNVIGRMAQVSGAPIGKDMIILNVVCAPQGAEMLLQTYPDVRIVTAAIDDDLNGENRVIPGIGHTGERMYGAQFPGVHNDKT